MSDRGAKALAKAVQVGYAKGLDDYHMEALVRADGKGTVQDGDSVVFGCRRGEREIELTELFTDPGFSKVKRTWRRDLDFVILTQYHEKFRNLPIAFGPQHVDHPLAQVLSEAGKSQFHCAESEKFAHVTFFFNGGENKPFPHENDVCVPSPKGVPFETVPELSLPKVVKYDIDAIGSYDFIVTNFANGDVIGHTASVPAKLKACAAVSRHLEMLVQKALEKDYVTIITADHGNIEKLYTDKGTPDVAHTTNKVACIIMDPRHLNELIPLKVGTLADVAPTVLDIMGLRQPSCMTGTPLVRLAWGANRKVLLVILDGWGMGSYDENDAMYLSDTPFWDWLLSHRSWCRLEASGRFVGLGEGKAGNSEAGHSNLGAGRCVAQDDIRLDAALADGSFFQNPAILAAIRRAKTKGKRLHVITYLSHASSHGSMDYALAVCRMAKAEQLSEVYLHIIFDGRSTETGSAPQLLEELERHLDAIGIGEMVSGIGRGLALDRDGNYERVKQAYDAMVDGTGVQYPV